MSRFFHVHFLLVKHFCGTLFVCFSRANNFKFWLFYTYVQHINGRLSQQSAPLSRCLPAHISSAHHSCGFSQGLKILLLILIISTRIRPLTFTFIILSHSICCCFLNAIAFRKLCQNDGNDFTVLSSFVLILLCVSLWFLVYFYVVFSHLIFVCLLSRRYCYCLWLIINIASIILLVLFCGVKVWKFERSTAKPLLRPLSFSLA